MIVKINTGALSGLDGKHVIVEADFSNGLPSFVIASRKQSTRFEPR
jgi:hypothetical protein